MEMLKNAGISAEQGARPLNRYLDRVVLDKLSHHLLNDKSSCQDKRAMKHVEIEWHAEQQDVYFQLTPNKSEPKVEMTLSDAAFSLATTGNHASI